MAASSTIRPNEDTVRRSHPRVAEFEARIARGEID